MFEQTAAWLRRVVKHEGQSADPPRVSDEDRRVWVRYPADMETTLQPAGPHALPLRMHARIHDVSQGGVKLLILQRFEPGSLLSIELPAASGTTLTVLACVLHLQELPDGYFAHGCQFVNELTQEDMDSLGVQRRRSTSSDPRNWARFPAPVSAKCQVLQGGAARTVAMRVANLSASGIALEAEEPIDAGTLLNVELQGPHGTPHEYLVCVVHVTASADGKCTLGCNFIRELDADDLQALL